MGGASGSSAGEGPDRSIGVELTYGQKFLVMFVVVFAVVGLTGSYIYLEAGDRLEANSLQQFEERSQTEAQLIEAHHASIEASLVHAGEHPPVTSGDETATARYLERVHRAQRFPDSTVAIAYVDLESGEVLVSTDPQFAGADVDRLLPNVADADLAAPDDMAISRPYQFGDEVTEAEGRPIEYLSYVSPVDGDPDRAVLAIVDVYADSERLFASEQGNTYVVHSDEYTIHSTLANHVNETIELHTVIDRSTFDEVAGSERSERYILDHHGIPRVSGVTAVGGTDWVVVSQQPAGDAFALHSSIRRVLLAGGGVLGVTLLLSGVVVGRGIRDVRTLAEKATAVSEGEFDVEIEHHADDEMGQLYRAVASMRDRLRNRLVEVTEAREAAETAQSEAERRSRHLQEKADEYQRAMRAAATGDLTVRADPASDNEAMEEIGREFNRMVERIETIVGQLKAFAADVATASEEVTASSEQVQAASRQVSESVQEISDGAERQNERLQRATTEVDGLSTTVAAVAEISDETASLARRTATAGRDGREDAEVAVEGLSEIEASTEQTVEEFEALESEMTQIDELVEFIQSVAEQTNMLALNANIEASRSNTAGGGGGFGAVAEEVQSLADETKRAADDVEERLTRIGAQTERASDEIRRTRRNVSTYADAIQNAIDALEDVASYAEETDDAVREISEATDRQADAAAEVADMVEAAARISDETTAESENVAAAAEEQTTALAEVSRSANDLASQASILSEQLLARFDTGDEPATGTTFRIDSGGDDRPSPAN